MYYEIPDIYARVKYTIILFDCYPIKCILNIHSVFVALKPINHSNEYVHIGKEQTRSVIVYSACCYPVIPKASQTIPTCRDLAIYLCANLENDRATLP